MNLRTRMNQTTMTNPKLRMKEGVGSGPTATLTKNATLPLLEELQHKNASPWKYVDVRSAPTATLTKNATFPLLGELQNKNARSLKCADVRSTPAASLPENASLPMMEESNASSWKNATELKT